MTKKNEKKKERENRGRYEVATDPNPYILNRCRMTKAKEETGEYTPVHSGNLHIDFPGKMRYSWETASYVAETEGDPRDRDTPNPFESRVDCDTPSTEEVKKEKNPTGKQERKETGGERGRGI